MVARLRGDRFTEEECTVIAKEVGDGMPASNICRYCGEIIQTMCFTMTGSCCDAHDKLRHNPEVYRNQFEFAQKFTLPPRDIPPATEASNARSQTDL